jgi:drug/metabolite transporter superfamily protein YnfA
MSEKWHRFGEVFLNYGGIFCTIGIVCSLFNWRDAGSIVLVVGGIFLLVSIACAMIRDKLSREELEIVRKLKGY